MMRGGSRHDLADWAIQGRGARDGGRMGGLVEPLRGLPVAVCEVRPLGNSLWHNLEGTVAGEGAPLSSQ